MAAIEICHLRLSVDVSITKPTKVVDKDRNNLGLPGWRMSGSQVSLVNNTSGLESTLTDTTVHVKDSTETMMHSELQRSFTVARAAMFRSVHPFPCIPMLTNEMQIIYHDKVYGWAVTRARRPGLKPAREIRRLCYPRMPQGNGTMLRLVDRSSNQPGEIRVISGYDNWLWSRETSEPKAASYTSFIVTPFGGAATVLR